MEVGLFSKKARGGVIGGTGYNFQDAYIVTQIPEWLLSPHFASFMKEGLDDVDVHIECNSRPEIWYYQIKSHKVTKKDLQEIVRNFSDKLEQPGITLARPILGCCGLIPDIGSLYRKIREFRELQKSNPIEALCRERADIVDRIAKLGLADHTDMVLDRLEVEETHPGLRDTDPAILMDIFRGRFVRLPSYGGEDHSIIDEVFKELALWVNKGIRVTVTRSKLEKVIAAGLANARKGSATVVYLHVWQRQDHDIRCDHEIDWTEHFDQTTRSVPPPATWNNKLLPELRDLREAFDRESRKRNIELYSRAPLSAGIAFGHTFSDASGYSIQIKQRSPGATSPLQLWCSDAPIQDEPEIIVEAKNGDRTAKGAVVAVGVTGDPRARLKQCLEAFGISVKAFLYIAPTAGVGDTAINKQNVVGFARAVKREMRSFCDDYSPRTIHFFYYGPFGLSVLIGQKLNGLVDIQCYERHKTQGYSPSCLLFT